MYLVSDGGRRGQYCVFCHVFSLSSSGGEGWGEEAPLRVLPDAGSRRVLDIESLGFSGCWMLMFGSIRAGSWEGLHQSEML